MPSAQSTTARSWQLAAPRPPITHSRRSSMMLGVYAMAIAVCGLGVWLAMVPIASAVVAAAKIAIAGKRKEIQHLDGGIVKAIYVRDGDHIKEGAILFELDDTRAKARHTLTRGAYFSALAVQGRLVAERDGTDSIAFATDLVAEARQSADAAQVVGNQQRIFEGRRREMAGQVEVSVERIAQLKEEIGGLTSERVSAAEQSELALKELAVIEEMFARGYVNRQRVHAIKRESAQLAGSLGRLDASVAKARKEIGETELSIRQLKLKRQTEVLTELKDIEQRLFELKETYLAAQAELGRLTMAAPVSGVAMNSQLHTVGGVIRSGQTVLEVVPAEDALIVEARVRPLDIDNVRQGQETEVRLAAFKQSTTPLLAGVVLHVSADAISDPRTGELHYTAIINIPLRELARLGPEQRLQPGMPAEVLIKTGQRTPLQYLMQPLLDSMHRAWRER